MIKYSLSDSPYNDNAAVNIYFFGINMLSLLPWKHYKKVEREKTIQEKREDKLKKLANPVFIAKTVYKKDIFRKNKLYKPIPRYGFFVSLSDFTLYFGEKTFFVPAPWNMEWFRTSALGKNGKWIDETKFESKYFYQKETWGDILQYETYPYKYINDSGEEENCLATIRVEEREWRWRYFFKYFKFTQKIIKTICVEFNKGVGLERVVACSYEMRPNETSYETLKRM